MVGLQLSRVILTRNDGPSSSYGEAAAIAESLSLNEELHKAFSAHAWRKSHYLLEQTSRLSSHLKRRARGSAPVQARNRSLVMDILQAYIHTGNITVFNEQCNDIIWGMCLYEMIHHWTVRLSGLLI